MLTITLKKQSCKKNILGKYLKVPTIFGAACMTLLFSNFSSAQTRNVNVHLFEWKWNDIKKECAYLQEKGYGSVQVSPPNEHAVVNNNPWWQRYQPVSYELTKSRSGTIDEFKSMVETCWKNHGVKVYVDAVINHMAAGDGIGSNGTPYQGKTNYYLYTKNGIAYRYDSNDFHNQCKIDYSNADSIRKCWIEGSLPDLVIEDTAGDRAKTRIAEFLNSMIDMGVAGFRIDAAKHMHPNDIVNINSRLKNLRSDANWFATGERPYIYQEVIWGDRQPVKPEDYQTTSNGKKLNVLEFRYGTEIAKKFRESDGQIRDFFTYNFPVASSGWGMLDSSYSFVFTDNHDNQRGHGSGYFTSEDDNSVGGIVTHYYDGALYNLANVFMLAWPYGSPQVMSSYAWPRDVRWDGGGNKYRDYNDWMGPPSDASGNTNNVSCGNGWVCEHRWGSIAGMVGFNNYTQDAWNVGYKWSDGGRKIGFARVKGNGTSSGYVVINRDGSSINTSINTGLPAGTYCDVGQADFNFVTRTCTGPTIEVNASGFAQFNVGAMKASAIHVGAKANTNTCWTSSYYRGTSNGWNATAMTNMGNCKWQYVVNYLSTDTNPRFKVCRLADWTQCVPVQDYAITQGSGKYFITYDSAANKLDVVKEIITPTVSVDFSCDQGFTTNGISVYVVGNNTRLGPWKVASIAQKLSPSAYPRWTGKISLPANTSYAWKCVKAKEADLSITEWESGSDNVFSTTTQNISVNGGF